MTLEQPSSSANACCSASSSRAFPLQHRHRLLGARAQVVEQRVPVVAVGQGQLVDLGHVALGDRDRLLEPPDRHVVRRRRVVRVGDGLGRGVDDVAQLVVPPPQQRADRVGGAGGVVGGLLAAPAGGRGGCPGRHHQRHDQHRPDPTSRPPQSDPAGRGA
jgi:hypothetical protein